MIALLKTKTQLRQWSMRYDVSNFDRPMDQCRNFPVFDTIKQKLEYANQCRASYIKLQLEYGKYKAFWFPRFWTCKSCRPSSYRNGKFNWPY
jgi:hypothetical protein